MFYFLHVKSKCIYTFICLLFIFYFFFNLYSPARFTHRFTTNFSDEKLL